MNPSLFEFIETGSGDGNAEEWQHEPRGGAGDGFKAVTATGIFPSKDDA